jgi:hypothetical protein
MRWQKEDGFHALLYASPEDCPVVPGERELKHARFTNGKGCHLPPMRWLKAGLLDFYRALDAMMVAETHRRDQYQLMLSYMTSVSIASQTPLAGAQLKKLTGFLQDVHAVLTPNLPRAKGDKSELEEMANALKKIVGEHGENSEVRVNPVN